jgi:FG-GAP repeat
MEFDLQVILRTNYEFSGRFGTTLGKIGDINHDGYNDIAISAPFEGNGAVYIYLGGPDGVSTKPSQRIQAPSEIPIPYPGFETQSAMFGHGLSRGVDIDGNGYRDIAIGSPNSESVYIFKTYPVVKVVSSIQPSKSELSLDDTRFNMKVCAHIDTVTNLANEIGESLIV